MSDRKTFRFDKEEIGTTINVYGQILEVLEMVDPNQFGDGPDREDEIVKYCLEHIVLPDDEMDGTVFGKFIKEHFKDDDHRKAAAKAALNEHLGKEDLDPNVEMYLSQMSQDYIPFDTVLTAGVVVGKEDKSLQMGCGQGKTGVLAFAAYQKMKKDEQVFLTSSTPILAAEALDTLEYYYNLGMAQDLVLVSPEGVTRAKLNDDKEPYTQLNSKGVPKVVRETINFADISSEEKKELLTSIYSSTKLVVSDNATLMQHQMEGFLQGPPKTRALLADEADYSLLDSYQPVQKTQDYTDEQVASKMIGRQKAYEILEAVKASLGMDRLCNKDDDNQYVDFTQEARLAVVEAIKQAGGDTEKSDLYDMVYDALVVDTVYQENRDYQILDDGKTIISENRASGAAMDLPQGIQQALEVKLQAEGRYSGDITREKEVLSVTNIQKFFTSTFSKGKTSFISGTLGLDSEEVVSELNKNFYIEPEDVYEAPPRETSIRDDRGKTLFQNTQDKHSAIIENALSEIRAGRPVLVGTISEKEIRALQEQLKGSDVRVLEYTAASETIFARDKEQMTDNDFQAKYGVAKDAYKKYEDFIKIEAGKENTITLGTSIIGRGTTIKISDEINKAGGIHVIVDGLHETSSRNQEQYLARVARGTDKGSTIEFFSMEDIPQAVKAEIFKEGVEYAQPGTPENRKIAENLYKNVYKKVDERTSNIRANVVNLMTAIENAKMLVQDEFLSDQAKKEVMALVSARAIQIQHRAVGVSEKDRYKEYEKQVQAFAEMYAAREATKEAGVEFDEHKYLASVKGYEDIADTYIPFSKEKEQEIFKTAGILETISETTTTEQVNEVSRQTSEAIHEQENSKVMSGRTVNPGMSVPSEGER